MDIKWPTVDEMENLKKWKVRTLPNSYEGETYEQGSATLKPGMGSRALYKATHDVDNELK